MLWCGRFLQPGRKEVDVFPKFYRLNTLRDIQEHFKDGQWLNATYTSNPGTTYHGNNAVLYNLIKLLQKVTPSSLATVILIFARRIA